MATFCQVSVLCASYCHCNVKYKNGCKLCWMHFLTFYFCGCIELLTDSLVTSCISLLQVEALERVKKSETDEDQADEKALVQEELSKIMINPNVFTDFKVAGSPEVPDISSAFLCSAL